jgi:hypothetical protein
MKRINILYGLELIIFNYERQSFDYPLIEKLMNKKYIDWFAWYDDKEGRYKYQINTTHKGLMYYATNRSKRRSKFYFVLTTIILIIPYVAILLSI